MVLHLRGSTCAGSTIKIRNGGVCYISFMLDFIYNGNMMSRSPNTEHTEYVKVIKAQLFLAYLIFAC